MFSYKWVLEKCDIVDRKMQLKLIRLAKDLRIPEMEMYIFLEPLPDVSIYFKFRVPNLGRSLFMYYYYFKD
jgi:hypothetical protein